MGLLDGRVVIVTGGGRGIGRSHCLELAGQGAVVVVNDPGVGVHGESAEESPADEVVNEIVKGGGEAMANRASVTDFDAVGDLVAQTVKTYGRLDAVVNNAGIVRDRMITSLTIDDFDAVMAVHVRGTWSVTKHACDHWRSVVKGGDEVSARIVNTTSGAGLFGNLGQTPYGAAKAAIANLTVITAMEMERLGVTANAISPIAYTRMVATMPGMTEYEPDPEWDRLDAANSSPVVAWLCSLDSGWLTGTILRVDGGTVMRMQPWDVDRSTTYSSRSGKRLEVAELSTGLRKAFRLSPSGMPSGGPLSP
jgi:NAD(P)-dependent dehydrogenase (short-subunit alcohol dehydrogenase family)